MDRIGLCTHGRGVYRMLVLLTTAGSAESSSTNQATCSGVSMRAAYLLQNLATKHAHAHACAMEFQQSYREVPPVHQVDKWAGFAAGRHVRP